MTRFFTLAFCLLSTTAAADFDAGAYLAARQAGLENDFHRASEYYPRALESDPDDVTLVQGALASNIALGNFDQAVALAERLIELGEDTQIAHITRLSDNVTRGEWDAVLSNLEQGHQVGPLIDSLAKAWAYVGKGDMETAFQQLDDISQMPGFQNVGGLHKVFALSLVGDLETADALLSAPEESGVLPTFDALTTHIEILSRMGEFGRAEALLNDAFGASPLPEVTYLRDAIAAQKIPENALIQSPADAVAYSMLNLVQLLEDEVSPAYLLMYARSAEHISPRMADTYITTGRLLANLEQYDLAEAAYAAVPESDPKSYVAELGRAGVLRMAGGEDAAIEVLDDLTSTYSDVPVVYAMLGDHLRWSDQFEDAKTAYTKAITLSGEDDSNLWRVMYTRGITNERLGDWDAAEQDFRRSLAINPSQPSVLNYFGYSMVELGINLDEALSMIRTAVEIEPENGAIVDSLGWALYKLGDYPGAVTQLERAVELEPVDPIVTDHLGDAYWQVGREDEAHFQWSRALSFEPEDDLAEKIRAKLQDGLPLSDPDAE